MGRHFFFPQYALEHVTWEIKTGLKNALEIQGYCGDSKVIERLDKRTHIRSSKFPVTSSLLLVRQVKQELFSQWCLTQQPTYDSVHASHILNEISQTHKWIYWGSLYPTDLVSRLKPKQEFELMKEQHTFFLCTLIRKERIFSSCLPLIHHIFLVVRCVFELMKPESFQQALMAHKIELLDS